MPPFFIRARIFKRLWSRNRVFVPARQATYAGGIHSLESIPGLHKRLKIRALLSTTTPELLDWTWRRYFWPQIFLLLSHLQSVICVSFYLQYNQLWPQESLVLYKTYNTLWIKSFVHYCSSASYLQQNILVFRDNLKKNIWAQKQFNKFAIFFIGPNGSSFLCSFRPNLIFNSSPNTTLCDWG